MKKYIVLFICVFLMCIFMVSCGNPAGASTNASVPSDNGGTAANTDGGASNANIFGAISEIAGNLATINLAVMPDTGMPVPGNRPAGFNAANIDPSNLPSGVTINADGSISVDRSAFGGDGTMTFDPNNMPQDFTGGGGGFQRATDANGQPVTRQRPTDTNGQPITRTGGYQRQTDANGQPVTRQQTTDENGNPVRGGGFGGLGGGMLLDYTGESKEFILPVGLPIYAVTRGDDGNQVETEIQLSDIKAGNVISVTYKADGKSIDKILVSQVTVLSPSEAEAMRNQISDRMNNQDTTEPTVASESGE